LRADLVLRLVDTLRVAPLECARAGVAFVAGAVTTMLG